MVAYNFQGRFAGMVEAGTKRQTIRQSARCAPGDALQLYTGQRTKECRKLRDAVCVAVESCIIRERSIIYAGRRLDDPDAFARADGFADYAEMYAWFKEQYGSWAFIGKCIRWE